VDFFFLRLLLSFFDFFFDFLDLRTVFFRDPFDLELELELELEEELEEELELSLVSELESSFASELQLDDGGGDTCSMRELTAAVLGKGGRRSNDVLSLESLESSFDSCCRCLFELDVALRGLNSDVPGVGEVRFSLIMPRMRRRRFVNPVRIDGLSGRSLGVAVELA
jgi:hypothetical protein